MYYRNFKELKKDIKEKMSIGVFSDMILKEGVDYSHSNTYGITIDIYCDLKTGRFFAETCFPGTYSRYPSEIILVHGFQAFNDFATEDLLGEDHTVEVTPKKKQYLLDAGIDESDFSDKVSYYDISYAITVDEFIDNLIDDYDYQDAVDEVIQYYVNEWREIGIDYCRWREIEEQYEKYCRELKEKEII